MPRGSGNFRAFKASKLLWINVQRVANKVDHEYIFISNYYASAYAQTIFLS